MTGRRRTTERCTTKGCRCVARRNGLCLACLAGDAWKHVDELPRRLYWLDLGRLEVCDPKPGWERYGACFERGDTKVFYPEANQSATKAIARCDRCPARYACLAVGLAAKRQYDHGVWGGTTTTDRVKIRRALAAREAAS